MDYVPIHRINAHAAQVSFTLETEQICYQLSNSLIIVKLSQLQSSALTMYKILRHLEFKRLSYQIPLTLSAHALGHAVLFNMNYFKTHLFLNLGLTQMLQAWISMKLTMPD